MMCANCFQNVCDFVVDCLPSLESMKIGDNCFSIENDEYSNIGCWSIDYYKRSDTGRCSITNCPNLRQLEIGKGSCNNFNSFMLFNINSLPFIHFDYDDSFQNIDIIVIDSLPNLESVKTNKYYFCLKTDHVYEDSLFRITNCPKLRQLEIGSESCNNFHSIELFYLDSLQSIQFGDGSFYHSDILLKGE